VAHQAVVGRWAEAGFDVVTECLGAAHLPLVIEETCRAAQVAAVDASDEAYPGNTGVGHRACIALAEAFLDMERSNIQAKAYPAGAFLVPYQGPFEGAYR
jgi:hypothetical protein